eukprot:scaffold14607_cov123-Isochrysis_galbana.AAC.3
MRDLSFRSTSVHMDGLDILGVLHRVGAAADGTGDGARLASPALVVALNPHEHLGRGAHQVLGLRRAAAGVWIHAEVDQEAIRGGVARAQPAEDLRRRVGARLGEISDLELLLRARHLARKGAGLVVAPERQLRLAERDVWHRRAGARQPGGGLAAAREVVGEAPGTASVNIHHEELVGQVEQQVALALHPSLVRPHRLKLEREVVAKRAVQTEHRLGVAAEEVAQAAHHGEDGVLPRPLLLGEVVGRGLDGHVHGKSRDRLARAERRVDRSKQHLAARIERANGECATGSLNAKRRVDEAHGPTRVPATGRGCEHVAIVEGRTMRSMPSRKRRARPRQARSGWPGVTVRVRMRTVQGTRTTTRTGIRALCRAVSPGGQAQSESH